MNTAKSMKICLSLLVFLLCSLPMVAHAQQAQITPLSGSVLQGNSVTFDASNSSGTIDTYHWNFDDGSTTTGRTVSKSFGAAGIYRVTLTVSNSTRSNSSSALVRVHTLATVNVPQVMLDTDAGNEQDDQHYLAYALFSELDVLGINSIHHQNKLGTEESNYKELLKIVDLAKKSGLPDARVPRIFRGAKQKLTVPASNKWYDTQFIVTEASNAILAAARGASPDNPVWVLPVGPGTNIATALLQVRQDGWETEFRKRIRVHWVGGSRTNIQDDFNGQGNPWSLHVTYESGIEFLVLTEPASRHIKVDKRVDGHRYPNNPLGDYLKSIMPDANKSLYDIGVPADIISMHLGKSWIRRVEPRILVNTYEYQTTTTPTNLNVISEVDTLAIVDDFFNTLNGKPTALPPMRQKR